MPNFYFEQLLQTGLNGIDQRGITAAVLQIAGVILILSLLWSVYEAYSNGGDVRLLGVAAVAAVVVAGVWVAVHQSQAHLPPDGSWPMYFQTASRWAWAGVVFLGAEGVVDVVLRRRAASRRGGDPEEGA